MKRRTFIRSLYTAAGATALLGTYAWQVEPFWVEFVKQEMPIRHLPKSLEGKTLMQISDIHVGNRFDWQYLIESFQKAQQFSPDLVVYTGDYVSYVDEEQIAQLETVLQSAVKGRLGTVAILGNHDYGKNWAEPKVAEAIVGTLEKAKIQVLRNDKAQVAGLTLVGLDDYWGTNFDPQPIMASLDDRRAQLVLCHNPDVCDMPVWEGYRGWILSGHTHGGQCKPPFLPPPILPVKNSRYSAGKIPLSDERTLYINRALGHRIQVRLNVRPEITIFTLMRA